MKGTPIETIQGSGNVFRDLGLPNPELEQLRTSLAAEIIAGHGLFAVGRAAFRSMKLATWIAWPSSTALWLESPA